MTKVVHSYRVSMHIITRDVLVRRVPLQGDRPPAGLPRFLWTFCSPGAKYAERSMGCRGERNGVENRLKYLF
jgi:hypothetical protein